MSLYQVEVARGRRSRPAIRAALATIGILAPILIFTTAANALVTGDGLSTPSSPGGPKHGTPDTGIFIPPAPVLPAQCTVNITGTTPTGTNNINDAYNITCVDLPAISAQSSIAATFIIGSNHYTFPVQWNSTAGTGHGPANETFSAGQSFGPLTNPGLDPSETNCIWNGVYTAANCGGQSVMTTSTGGTAYVWAADIYGISGTSGVVSGQVWTYAGASQTQVGWATLNTANTGNPCTLTDVSGDTSELGQTSTGGTYNWVLEYSGQVNALVAVDPASTVTAITIYGKNFAGDAATDYTTVSSNNLGSPQVLTQTITSGHTVDAHLWCHTGTSAGGQWVDWGDLNTYVSSNCISGPQCPGNTSFGGTTLGQCLNSATGSLSLYNPLSWVAAGVEMGACVLQWLFIPSSATISTLANQFGVHTSTCSSGGTATMSQWFGCLAGALVVSPASDVASIKTTADSASCTDNPGGGNTITIAGQSVSACTIAADVSNVHFSTDASTMLGLFQTLMTAVIYLLGAYMLFWLVKRIVTGGAES